MNPPSPSPNCYNILNIEELFSQDMSSDFEEFDKEFQDLLSATNPDTQELESPTGSGPYISGVSAEPNIREELATPPLTIFPSYSPSSSNASILDLSLGLRSVPVERYIIDMTDAEFSQQYNQLGIQQTRTKILGVYRTTLQKIFMIEEKYSRMCVETWHMTMLMQHLLRLKQHIKHNCNNVLVNLIQQGIPVVEEKKKGKPRKLPESVTKVLSKWFLDHCDHPYPNGIEKEDLMKETGLTLTQLNNWFINKVCISTFLSELMDLLPL